MGITEVNEENLKRQADGAHRGIQSRQEKLDQLSGALNAVVGNGNLSGQTAQSMNAYINDVHVNGILRSLQTLIQAYDDATVRYVAGYPQVDSHPMAHLLKDELEDHKKQLQTFQSEFDQVNEQVLQIVNSVSSIYTPGAYYGFLNMMGIASACISDMEKIVKELSSNWEAFERTNYYEAVATLLPYVQKAIQQYKGKNLASVSSYVAGTFATLHQDLGSMTDQMGQFHNEHATEFSDAWKKIQEQEKIIDDAREKAIEEAKKQGWENLGKDVFFLLAGAIITVATGGTGAPLAAALIISSLPAAVDIASDFRQGFTGNTKNYGVQGFEMLGMDTEMAEITWIGTSILTSSAGSGKAYSELVEVGVAKGTIREIKPIFKTAFSSSEVAFGNPMSKAVNVMQDNGAILKSQILPHLAEGASWDTYATKQFVYSYGKAAGEATANQMATQMVIDPALNAILGDNPDDLDTASKALGLTNLSNKTAVSIFSLAE